MLLEQISLIAAYRTFGVPIQTILSTSTSNFHNPKFKTTHKGAWVALDKSFVLRYGVELGNVSQFSLPILNTYKFPASIFDKEPDVPSEGRAYVLDPTIIPVPSKVEMYIYNKWQPFDRNVLKEALHTVDGIKSIVHSQELWLACPNHCPGSKTTLSDLTSSETLLNLCSTCKSKLSCI